MDNPQGYKPTVSVSTEAKAGQILIIVRDNGNGIPDSVKDKIMQPFFTTKPTGEGTGLGLSLSYDIIVKGHNGKIDVKSEENNYTEFTITIPV
jgi:signal transduction histidine kinase